MLEPDYNTLANLKYCYQFFLDSKGLLFYTHIPPIVVALGFASFIALKTRDRVALLLSAIAITFSLYAVIDLLQWIFVGSNSFIMASWSLLGVLTVLIFYFTHWFVHAFVTRNDLPVWMNGVWMIVMAPVFIFTPTSYNITAYDIRSCIAVENPLFTYYYYSLGILAILFILISAFVLKKENKEDLDHHRVTTLAVIGSILFVSTFLITGVLASYLVDQGYIPDFGLSQYGIAAMSIFIGFLAYITAYFRGFNVKILSAQLLVVGLVILIASEFLFVTSFVSRSLVLLTLGLAIIFGVALIRSVQREVRQRELIELQEKELEIANQRQESLLHFISHEVKGYLTEGQNVFASIVEKDFGEPTPQILAMSEAALGKMRQGVETVMNILSASNLKQGTVSYKKTKASVAALVDKEVGHLRLKAIQKGLLLDYTPEKDKAFEIELDAEKFAEHVIRNLIDNSIRYTPKGSVTVRLMERAGKIRLSIKDTGVGITSEDMQKLFTEGGHGKESIKVNVDSTGYGLFIAKQVVEAHGGKIWAESAGAGKGSEFIVELPMQ